MKEQNTIDFGAGMVMPSSSTRERRKNDRLAYSAKAVIESLDAIPLAKAHVLNYSCGGLYIETDALITPGTVLYLGIADSPYIDASTQYECHRVKVKWCKDLYHSGFKYGYGVQHLDPIGVYSRDMEKYFYDIPQYLKLVMADKKESRKYPRKSASRPVLFTTAAQCYEGVIENVSKGGLFIATESHFQIGDMIKLVVPGTKYDKGVMIKAQIVHRNHSGIGVKLLGIQKAQD